MTTRQTLMREPNSLLGRMFDIDSPLTPAAKDKVFLDIDRNTTYIFLMHKKGLLEVQYATTSTGSKSNSYPILKPNREWVAANLIVWLCEIGLDNYNLIFF